MAATHLKLIAKHGEWLVEVGGDLLGPYPYDHARTVAIVLAEVAWELGHDASVVIEEIGVLHTLWNHPALRHERYA